MNLDWIKLFLSNIFLMTTRTLVESVFVHIRGILSFLNLLSYLSYWSGAHASIYFQVRLTGCSTHNPPDVSLIISIPGTCWKEWPEHRRTISLFARPARTEGCPLLSPNRPRNKETDTFDLHCNIWGMRKYESMTLESPFSVVSKPTLQ